MAYIGYKRTIQLDFNYDAVKQGVPKVNQQIALLNSEFNKASAQIQATGSAMDKLTINNQKLVNQVQLQKDKVNGLQKELEKLTSAENKNERAIASKKIELNNAQTQLTKYQMALQTSNQEMAKASTITGQAKLALEDFRLGAERAGVNLEDVKNKFIGLTTATSAFIAVSGNAFMDYEEKLVMARNLMDENVMSYEELNRGVKDLANQYGIAAAEMASAMEMALSSNVETADSINFLSEASKFAVSTGTDLVTTVDLLTSIMNSYGLSVNDLNMYMDQMIVTQDEAKVTWENYNSEIGALAALGATVGVGLDEINAALVVQTRRGIDSATSLINLKNIIQAIASPTSKASSAADALGIQFNAAALKGQGFAKTMDAITKATKGDAQAMGELFGNVRSWLGAQVIAQNGGEEFKQVLMELQTETGNLDNYFSNVTDTTNYKFSASLNRLKNSIVEVGETISPIIDGVSNVINIISAIPAPITITVASIAGLIVTVGIMNKMWAAFMMSGGLADTVLTKLGITTAAATAANAANATSLGVTATAAGIAASSLTAESAAAAAATASTAAITGTSATASAALIGVGSAGEVAGAGLTAAGMGGLTAVSPILVVVAAIAGLILLIALLCNHLSKTKSEMSSVGEQAKKTANDIKNATTEAEKSANSAVNSTKRQIASTGKIYTSTIKSSGNGHYTADVTGVNGWGNSDRAYATGTNYVKEDGYYLVGENGPERVWLNRGNSVDNASQTRKDTNNKVDMTETNSLLKTLILEINDMKRAYQEQPRQMLRLSREGGL